MFRIIGVHISDWTASKIYTLDAKSMNVLKGLSQPVHIYVMEETQRGLGSQQIHELMDNIRSANSKVQVEFHVESMTSKGEDEHMGGVE